MPPLRKFKFVFLGDPHSGMRSLIQSFYLITEGDRSRFFEVHRPAVPTTKYGDGAYLRENIVEFNTSSMSEFVDLELAHLYQEKYRGTWKHDERFQFADVYIFCFDVTNADMVHSLPDQWVSLVRAWTGIRTKPIRNWVRTLLVGTKIDLRENDSILDTLRARRTAPYDAFQGEAYAKYLGLSGYAECSSLTMDGVKEVFEKAVQIATTSLLDRKRGCEIQ
ncbi:P-loop containing nucleoside triphosphate hydrolase protein [Flagelloscypha sp. PMI_526]|nr:P-loop containing nucleoside triphosphate hydrolase protein [Flagelloscypha sp. PMI_526]